MQTYVCLHDSSRVGGSFSIVLQLETKTNARSLDAMAPYSTPKNGEQWKEIENGYN